MRYYCTSLYICFLVLVFPLYYQNNYINMLEAKTTIYTIGTLLFAAAILIGLWYDSVKKYEAEQKLKKKQKTTSVHYEKSWITILFWIFIAVIFVSAIISGDFWNAWHAMETITIAAVLIAWMMQAAVNCSIVFTAPYLFAALGIARWQTRELSKEKK